MSTLADVTNQLSSLNATSSNTLTVAEKIQALLESSAADARASARNAREAASESRGGVTSRIAEGASNFGNAAASVGGGLAGLGAGIAGFMAALAVGSAGLDWIGADYSGLGKAFGSFSEAMENLSPAAILAIAGASVIAAKTSSFKNLYGLGTASGMVGLGAGIGGFLIGLSLGEVGLSWLGNDYTNLGKALASFSEAIGNLSLTAVALIGGVAAIAITNTAFGGNAASLALSMTGVGAGIAGFLAGLVLADVGIDWIQNITGADGSALVSAFEMFNNAVMALNPISIAALGGLLAVASKFNLPAGRIVMGMTGIGAGIASFMLSLAIGDAGINWIQEISGADGSALVSVFKMFNDSITALSPTSMTALAALLGIASAFTLPVGRILMGMTGVGAGIAGFMLSLAVGDAGITWIQEVSGADGSALVSVLKMFNDAVNALDTKALATLGVIMGIGIALGPAAAIGLGAMGAGIAAFITGLALGDGMLQLMSSATGGEPGEGLKMLIKNIFEGVAGIKVLDGLDLVGLGVGLGAVATGLAAFGVGSIISGLGQAVSSIIAFFTGESVFDQIMKIADKADGLMRGAEALERIAEALQKFGNIDINADNLDFEALSKNLIKTIPLLEMLAFGGETGTGWWDGEHVKIEKGLLSPDLQLDDMVDAMAKVNYILGKSDSPNVSAVAPQAIPSVGAADIQPIAVEDRQIPALVNAITAALPAGAGGGRGGGGGGSQTVHTATDERTVDILDARSARGI